jgi:metallo-beta-lactamase family protein
MQVQFLGATHTVTGSKHLLMAENRRVLVDCGLFQGLKDLRLRNWTDPPVDPRSVDAIVLTHAHIDHTGYLPRFVRQGFRGPIYGTPATIDLLRILLPDSAHLQEEEANYRNRKGLTKHNPALPLYTVQDADAALQLVKVVDYETPYSLAPHLDFTFTPAGHILGSAFVRFRGEKTILFTGDIGRYDTPIIKDPSPVHSSDYLVLESTYGNRLHGDNSERAGKYMLRDIIVETAQRGGVVLIPAFAVGRAQELLYYLRELENEGAIPILPVYIDSPMAIDAFDIYLRHTEEHDLEMAAAEKNGGHPLATKRMKFCRSVEESKAINDHHFPAVIISANGMATGGRIVHHLMARLPDDRNSVVFVGFQAAGTRGRYLAEGARSVVIYGSEFPVRARIYSIDGFSAHGDYREILKWLSGFEKPPQRTFLVHGEPHAMEAMKEHIEQTYRGWQIETPNYLETFTL